VQRTRYLVIVLTIVIGFPFRSTFAREKTYQTGKLVSIESPETPISLPLPSGQRATMAVALFYKFEIRQGDTLYVGTCLRNKYKAEWPVADDLQFRVRNDKMYLRRPKGGELALNFMLSAKLDYDGKPITVLGFAKKAQ
jgi:hypothetical protein